MAHADPSPTRDDPMSVNDDLRATIADVLSADPTVAAAYVYGSVARGAVTPLGDVDVAVLPVAALPATERDTLIRQLSLEALEAQVRERLSRASSPVPGRRTYRDRTRPGGPARSAPRGRRAGSETGAPHR